MTLEIARTEASTNWIEQYGPRESMDFDVVIVGGGPAGLSAAICLKRRAAEQGADISVSVLEKGSEIGAHILSGAVMDPRALDELIPDWKALGAPLDVPVTEDRFLFLSETGARAVPNWALPGNFKNHRNYVISLANLTRWLGQQAEALGVEIFGGFPAAEVLYHDDGSLKGVATGNIGVGRDGQPTDAFQLGMELHAKYTPFCEGARGHLGRQLSERFVLRDGVDPQVYGLSIKELWEIDPARHKPGLLMHTAGWPLRSDTYGGSFLYHLDNNQVMVGLVVSLGYSNPYLSPFEEFQRYKTHPAIRTFLEGGKRMSYGARAIAAGGLVSLPKLVFPGSALVGDDAGFLNALGIKGSLAALKTATLAADAAFDALQDGRQSDELAAYPESFKGSWLHDELRRARNFKQWMGKGLYLGTRRRAELAGRQGAVDAASPARGSRDAPARRAMYADRVSETRRQAGLRPALVRVHLEHQSRGGPTRTSDAQGFEGVAGHQSAHLHGAGSALLSGGRAQIRQGR